MAAKWITSPGSTNQYRVATTGDGGRTTLTRFVEGSDDPGREVVVPGSMAQASFEVVEYSYNLAVGREAASGSEDEDSHRAGYMAAISDVKEAVRELDGAIEDLEENYDETYE